MISKTKLLRILLICLIAQNCFAQLLTAEYESFYGDVSRKEYLTTDGKDALVVIESASFDSFISSSSSTNTSVTSKKLPELRYYKSDNSQNVYIQVGKADNLILDEIPKINWVINKSNHKTINDFKCFQATAEFRGSIITAYFTFDIPISQGPWKFKGLPGLILEIISNDSKFIWTISKLNFPASNTKENLTLTDSIKKSSKSMRSVMLQSENDAQARRSRIQSRLPSGTVVGKTTVTRKGFEKVFEWEND
jgi:GLPGLI family protein